MPEHWLITDEKADVVASLAMLEVALGQTAEDIAPWKWVVITTHSALQGAFACHLRSFGNSLLVARKDDAKAWIKAHEDRKLNPEIPYPEMRMAKFLELYWRVKHHEIYGYTFVPQNSQGRSIKKINEYRNNFLHFMPMSWSLEVSGLPNICIDCLDVINELNDHTLNLGRMDDTPSSKFSILMNSCMDKLKSLKVEYGT